MNVPNIYDASKFDPWTTTERYIAGSHKDGSTFYAARPARPLGFQGLFLIMRLKLAWRVFIGRYDVLDWSGKEPR